MHFTPKILIRASAFSLLPLGQHQNSLRADETHDPSDMGVIICHYIINMPFQNRADVKVLLLPISSGANGLNLVEASHVILVEPILNPAQELQVSVVCIVHMGYTGRRSTLSPIFCAINFGSSPGLWAATAASYCPSRQGELPKLVSTEYRTQGAAPPCTLIIAYKETFSLVGV